MAQRQAASHYLTQCQASGQTQRYAKLVTELQRARSRDGKSYYLV